MPLRSRLAAAIRQNTSAVIITVYNYNTSDRKKQYSFSKKQTFTIRVPQQNAPSRRSLPRTVRPVLCQQIAAFSEPLLEFRRRKRTVEEIALRQHTLILLKHLHLTLRLHALRNA